MKTKKIVSKLVLCFASLTLFGILSCSNGSTPQKTPELTGITITTNPNKLEYELGEEDFDPTGMVVEASYSDDSTKEVTTYECTGFDASTEGEKTLTVSYTEGKITKEAELAYSVTKSISEDAVVEKIEIANKESPLVVLNGKLDTKSLKVKATYSDGIIKTISEKTEENENGFTVSELDSSKLGATSVTVSYTYKEKTVSCILEIKIINAPLVSIEITSAPAKTEYFEKNELDLTGLVVSAVYENEIKTEITDYEVSGYDAAKIGQQTITVTYKEAGIEKSATFTVTVKENKYVGLEITKLPNTTAFVIGSESMDLTGMIISAVYEDGSKIAVTDYTTSGFDSSAIVAEQIITISYTEAGITKTVELKISIKPAIELSSIKVTKKPTRMTTYYGATFEPTGMEVTATYSDRSTAIIDNDKLTFDYDFTKKTIVVISYEESGKKVSYTFYMNKVSNEYIYCSLDKVDNVLTVPEGYTEVNKDSKINELKDVTEIILPSTLKTIGRAAFEGSSYSSIVEKITIPSGVTTISEYAFRNAAKLKELTIPDGVTKILDSTFSGCKSLEKITLSPNITSIAGGAFSSCENLVSLTLPENMTSIGSYAFNYCSKLESINLPVGITTIETSTFSNCKNLKSISIPEGVKTIDEYAFYSCSSLESLSLPSTLEYIGRSAFDSAVITELVIPDSVKTIDRGAFGYCRKITKIVLSENLEAIPECCFQYANALKEINFPASLTSIGKDAFYLASELTEIDLSATHVTSIGENAFRECSSVTTVKFPATLEVLDTMAFYNCALLGDILLADTKVTSIGEYAFCGCPLKSAITLPDTLITIGKSAFLGMKLVKSIIIPANVTSIGANAFTAQDGLESVTFKNTKGWKDSKGNPVDVSNPAENAANYRKSGLSQWGEISR